MCRFEAKHRHVSRRVCFGGRLHTFYMLPRACFMIMPTSSLSCRTHIIVFVVLRYAYSFGARKRRKLSSCGRNRTSKGFYPGLVSGIPMSSHPIWSNHNRTVHKSRCARWVHRPAASRIEIFQEFLRGVAYRGDACVRRTTSSGPGEAKTKRHTLDGLYPCQLGEVSSRKLDTLKATTFRTR